MQKQLITIESQIYNTEHFSSHGSPHPAWRALAELAQEYGLDHYSQLFLSRALTPSSKFPIHPHRRLSPDPHRFLLIKSWNHGFWSDVAHTLGGCLLAELTGRTPLIWWGTESLYRPDSVPNAFPLFFEQKPPLTRLPHFHGSFYPSTYSAHNIAQPRTSWIEDGQGLTPAQFLAAQADVLVLDHYLNLHDLAFWIPSDHPSFGLSLPKLYRRLVTDHLHARQEFLQQAKEFIRTHLKPAFLTVHLRGTDKETEVGNLAEINRNLLTTAKKALLQSGLPFAFVMTDCALIEQAAKKILQGKAVFMPVIRSPNGLPLHHAPERNPALLGQQILVECLIAAQSNLFIGNGASNVAAMIAHLRPWKEEQLMLLVPNQLYRHHPATYRI